MTTINRCPNRDSEACPTKKGEIADIIARRREVPQMTNLVFHRDGQPVREFRKSWASACKAAGVPDKLFHDLRRSAARKMIRSGTSRNVAKKIGGWKTDSMFDRYNITDDADIENAILQVTAHHANTKVVAIGTSR